MATVEELQVSLEKLRATHQGEANAVQATLHQIEEQLRLIQDDTEALEQQEQKLLHELSDGPDYASMAVEQMEFVLQTIRGLIDYDDARCRRA